MKIISSPRGMGKTTEIIKKCAKKGGYIVCFNMAEAQRVHGVAREMGLDIPFPITFQDFFGKKYYGKGAKRFYID